jgi:hypothetical protein
MLGNYEVSSWTLEGRLQKVCSDLQHLYLAREAGHSQRSIGDLEKKRSRVLGVQTCRQHQELEFPRGLRYRLVKQLFSPSRLCRGRSFERAMGPVWRTQTSEVQLFLDQDDRRRGLVWVYCLFLKL